MCVALVASPDSAVVGLVGGVHVRMFLTVAGVGKATVTSLELTLEGFLT